MLSLISRFLPSEVKEKSHLHVPGERFGSTSGLPRSKDSTEGAEFVELMSGRQRRGLDTDIYHKRDQTKLGELSNPSGR